MERSECHSFLLMVLTSTLESNTRNQTSTLCSWDNTPNDTELSNVITQNFEQTILSRNDDFNRRKAGIIWPLVTLILLLLVCVTGAVNLWIWHRDRVSRGMKQLFCRPGIRRHNVYASDHNEAKTFSRIKI